MKQSTKTALCGIIAALSVALMFLVSVVPFLTYALPALAGAFVILITIELDKKWAFGTYAAISALSLILVPNKEVAMLFASFFGYYPILKAVLESKLPKWLGYIIKVIIFDGTMVLSYIVMIKFMGVSFDDMEDLGRFAVPILLAAGTITFLLYDFALTRLIETYLYIWQKRFRKIFKFK